MRIAIIFGVWRRKLERELGSAFSSLPLATFGVATLNSAALPLPPLG